MRRVDALFVKKRKADERIAKLQADLDCELVAQRSKEGELDWLWKDFQGTELVLRKELSKAREELKNKSSELEERDSELLAAS